jgi:hypothetical protein
LEPLPAVSEAPSEPLPSASEPTTQQDAPTPADRNVGGTPPVLVSASGEKNAPMEEDLEAEAERAGREMTRRWLLAELAEARRKAADYRLRSTERLRAKQHLQALEWSWRLEFPDEPAG